MAYIGRAGRELWRLEARQPLPRYATEGSVVGGFKFLQRYRRQWRFPWTRI